MLGKPTDFLRFNICMYEQHHSWLQGKWFRKPTNFLRFNIYMYEQDHSWLQGKRFNPCAAVSYLIFYINFFFTLLWCTYFDAINFIIVAQSCMHRANCLNFGDQVTEMNKFSIVSI